ncbi:MAG TPA: hypothetical protein VGN97_03230 [Mesorhizobium sp.]|jgi:hypothetical protein|nr:hypothetical protein [Mesorhizobium sp.]
MSARPPRDGFAARPTSPDAWVNAPDKRAMPVQAFTARLTIDVTPALRGRIKVTAFRRSQTVADMLRALLEREFPDDLGSAS